MTILLKTTLVRVNFIQIMQIRVQNKGKEFGKVDTMETYHCTVCSHWQDVPTILGALLRLHMKMCKHQHSQGPPKKSYSTLGH